jgi:uncharacterized protein (TIGR02646 family)
MRKVNKRKNPPKAFLDAVAAIDEAVEAGKIVITDLRGKRKVELRKALADEGKNVVTDRYVCLKGDGKIQLRQALAEDQGFLCIYCERSLKDKNGDLKENCRIDHFKTRSLYNGQKDSGDLTLDYNNLFLACSGNVSREGLDDEETKLGDMTEHCDTSKGDRDFQYLKNPATWSTEEEIAIQFDNNYVSAADTGWLQELQGTYNFQKGGIGKPLNLHLNERKLQESRQETWEGVQSKISNKFKELTGQEISYKTWRTGGKALVQAARFYKRIFSDDDLGDYLEYRSAVLYQLDRRFKGRL